MGTGKVVLISLGTTILVLAVAFFIFSIPRKANPADIAPSLTK